MNFNELLEQEYKKLEEAAWRGFSRDARGNLTSGYDQEELKRTGRDPQETVWQVRIGQAEEMLYKYATGEWTIPQLKSALAGKLGLKIDLRPRNTQLVDIKTGRTFDFEW